MYDATGSVDDAEQLTSDAFKDMYEHYRGLFAKVRASAACGETMGGLMVGKALLLDGRLLLLLLLLGLARLALLSPAMSASAIHCTRSPMRTLRRTS